MKSVSGWIVGTCILALGLGAGPVSAATITETINFTASSFSAGAPVDPVIGAFTITLDPTVDTPFTVPPVGTAITLDNVNIPPGANAPSFFYSANLSGGFLTVCSPAFNGCGETAGFNGFTVRMINSKALQPSLTYPTQNRLWLIFFPPLLARYQLPYPAPSPAQACPAYCSLAVAFSAGGDGAGRQQPEQGPKHLKRASNVPPYSYLQGRRSGQRAEI